jgi:TP901 family phage tail tape measure protein
MAKKFADWSDIDFESINRATETISRTTEAINTFDRALMSLTLNITYASSDLKFTSVQNYTNISTMMTDMFNAMERIIIASRGLSNIDTNNLDLNRLSNALSMVKEGLHKIMVVGDQILAENSKVNSSDGEKLNTLSRKLADYSTALRDMISSYIYASSPLSSINVNSEVVAGKLRDFKDGIKVLRKSVDSLLPDIQAIIATESGAIGAAPSKLVTLGIEMKNLIYAYNEYISVIESQEIKNFTTVSLNALQSGIGGIQDISKIIKNSELDTAGLKTMNLTKLIKTTTEFVTAMRELESMMPKTTKDSSKGIDTFVANFNRLLYNLQEINVDMLKGNRGFGSGQMGILSAAFNDSVGDAELVEKSIKELYGVISPIISLLRTLTVEEEKLAQEGGKNIAVSDNVTSLMKVVAANIKHVMDVLNELTTSNIQFGNIRNLRGVTDDLRLASEIFKELISAYTSFSTVITSMSSRNRGAEDAADIARVYKGLMFTFRELGKDNEELASIVKSIEGTFAAVWRAISGEGINNAKETLDKLSKLVLSLISFNIPANASADVHTKFQELAKAFNLGGIGTGLSEIISGIKNIPAEASAETPITVINSITSAVNQIGRAFDSLAIAMDNMSISRDRIKSRTTASADTEAVTTITEQLVKFFSAVNKLRDKIKDAQLVGKKGFQTETKSVSEALVSQLTGIVDASLYLSTVSIAALDAPAIIKAVDDIINIMKIVDVVVAQGGGQSSSSALENLARTASYLRTAAEALSGIGAVPTTALAAAEAIKGVCNAIVGLEQLSTQPSKKLFKDIQAAFNGMIAVFNQPGIEEATARITGLMGAFASLVTVGVKGNQIGTIFGSIFDAIRKSSTEAADVTEKTVARIKNAINIATKAAEEEDLVVGRIGIKTMPTYVNTLTLGQAPASAVTSALDKVRRIYDALIVRADLFSSTYGKSWDVISNKANIAITNTEKEIAVMDILNKIKTHTPENIVLQSVDNQVKSINENIQALKLFQNELNKTTEDRKKYLETALMLINIDTELGKSASEVFKADPSSFTRLKSQIDMNEKNINIEQELVKMTSVEIKQQEQLLKIAKDKNIELVNMSKYLGVPKPVANLNATGNRLSNDTSTEINRLSSVMDVLSSANIRQQYTAEELSNAYRVLNNEISMNAQWRKTLVTSLNSEIDKLNVELKSLIASGQATSQQSTNLSVWISGLRELSATTLIDANSFITLQGSSIAAANGISSLTSKTEKYNTVLLSSEETLGQLNTRFAEMKIAGNAGVDVEAAKRAASLLTVVESTIKRIDLLSKEMRTGDMTPASRAELASLLEMQSRFGVIRTEIIGLVSGMKDFNTVSQKSAENIESLARIMAKDIIPLTTDKKTIWVGGGGTGGTGGGGGGGNIPGGTNPDIEKETARLIKLTEARIDNMEAAKANGLATLREAEEMRLSGVSMQTNIDALNNSSREILKRKLALETMIQTLEREAQAGNISRKVMEQLTIRMRESVNATGELGSMLKMQAASFKKFKDSARDAGEEIASTVAMQMRQFTSFTLLFGIMSSVRETFNKMVEESKYLGIALSASRSDVDSLSERLEILHDTMDRMRVKFGASSEEIGQSLYQMGSAGLNMKDMLASIEPIMNLIVGTGAEANSIAKTMAATFNVLSYQGVLTGNSLMDLGHIADVTAAIFRDNQIEIDEFTNALKYVLPIAHLVGVSFEELSAILGTLHNQGIKAGQAGRSLRSVFFSIAQNREKFERAFADLGIKIDPTGPLRFMDILDQLGDKLGKCAISVARLEQVVTALNMRGTGPFLLLAQGAGLLRQNLFLAKDGADGAASALAKIKIDTLDRQIKIMNENLFVFSKALVGWFVKGIEFLIMAFNKLAEVIRIFNDATLGIPAIFMGITGSILGSAAAIAIIRQVFLGIVGLIIYINKTINEFIVTTNLASGSIDIETASLYRNTLAKEVNATATANLSRSNASLVATAPVATGVSGFGGGVVSGVVGGVGGATIGNAAVQGNIFKNLLGSIGEQFKSLGRGFQWIGGLIKTHWIIALIAAIAATIGFTIYLNSTARALSNFQEKLSETDQLLQDIASSATERIKFETTATSLIENYKKYNAILKSIGSSATEAASAQSDLNNVLLQASQNTDIGFMVSVDSTGNLSLAVDELENLISVRKEMAKIESSLYDDRNDQKRIKSINDLGEGLVDIIKKSKELELKRKTGGLSDDDIKLQQELNKSIIDAIFKIRKADPSFGKQFAKTWQDAVTGINESIDKGILTIKSLKRELSSFGRVDLYDTLIEQSKEYKYAADDLNMSILETEYFLSKIEKKQQDVFDPKKFQYGPSWITNPDKSNTIMGSEENNNGAYAMIERLRKEYETPINIPVSFDDTLAKTALLSLQHIQDTMLSMNDIPMNNTQLNELSKLAKLEILPTLNDIQGKLGKGIMPSAIEALDLLNITSKWAEKINEIRIQLNLPVMKAWVGEFAGVKKYIDAIGSSLLELLLAGEQQVRWAEAFGRALDRAKTPIFGALAPAYDDLSLIESSLRNIAVSYTKQSMGIKGAIYAFYKGIDVEAISKTINIKHLAELMAAQVDSQASRHQVTSEMAGDAAALGTDADKAAGNKYMKEMEKTIIELVTRWSSLNHDVNKTLVDHGAAMTRLLNEQRKVIGVGNNRGDQLEYELALVDQENAMMLKQAEQADIDGRNGIAYREAILKFETEILAKKHELAVVDREIGIIYMESVGKLMDAAEGQRTMFGVAKDMIITYNKWYNIGQSMNELETRHAQLLKDIQRGTKESVKDIFAYNRSMQDYDRQRIDLATEYLNQLREMRGIIAEINNLYKEFLGIQKDAIQSMASVYEERLSRVSDAFSKIIESMASNSPSLFAIKTAVAMGSLEGITIDTSDAIQEMVKELEEGSIQSGLMGMLFGNSIGGMSKKIFELTNTIKQLGKEEAEITKKMAAFDINILSQILGKGIDKITMEDLGRAKESLSSLLGYSKEFAKVDPDSALELYRSIASIAGEMAQLTLMQKDELILRMGLDPTDFYKTLDQMTKKMEDFIDMVSQKYGGLTIQAYGLEGSKIDIKKLVLGTLQGLLAELLDKRLPMGAIVQPAQNTGNTVPHLASGGMVPGGSSAQGDIIPAMLTPGEFVIPADVVSRVGVGNFMNLISGGHGVMRFAEGGYVGDTMGRFYGYSTDRSDVLTALKAELKYFEGVLEVVSPYTGYGWDRYIRDSSWDKDDIPRITKSQYLMGQDLIKTSNGIIDKKHYEVPIIEIRMLIKRMEDMSWQFKDTYADSKRRIGLKEFDDSFDWIRALIKMREMSGIGYGMSGIAKLMGAKDPFDSMRDNIKEQVDTEKKKYELERAPHFTPILDPKLLGHGNPLEEFDTQFNMENQRMCLSYSNSVIERISQITGIKPLKQRMVKCQDRGDIFSNELKYFFDELDRWEKINGSFEGYVDAINNDKYKDITIKQVLNPDILERYFSSKSGKEYRYQDNIEGFATGGFVPGSGTGDTVPAMLTPGEFVIPAKIVDKIGSNNLDNMISGGHGILKFASGGSVGPIDSASYPGINFIELMKLMESTTSNLMRTVDKLSPVGINSSDDPRWNKTDTAHITSSQFEMAISKVIDLVTLQQQLITTYKSEQERISGNTESITSILKKLTFGSSTAYGEPIVAPVVEKTIDLSVQFNLFLSSFNNTLDDFIINLTGVLSRGISVIPATGFASGGSVPGSGNKDTIPAMLTPGEFVIPADVVSRIGADKLYKLIHGTGLTDADYQELLGIFDESRIGNRTLAKGLRRNKMSFYDYLNSQEDAGYDLYAKIRDFAQEKHVAGFNKGGLVGGVQYMASGGLTTTTRDRQGSLDISLNMTMVGNPGIIIAEQFVKELEMMGDDISSLFEPNIDSIRTQSFKTLPLIIPKQFNATISNVDFTDGARFMIDDRIDELESLVDFTIEPTIDIAGGIKMADDFLAKIPPVLVPTKIIEDINKEKTPNILKVDSAQITKASNELNNMKDILGKLNLNAMSKFETQWRKLLNQSIIKPFFAVLTKMRVAWKDEWSSMLDTTLPLIARFMPMIGQALIEGIVGAISGLPEIFNSVLGEVMDMSWIPFDDKLVDDTAKTMQDIKDSYEDGLAALVKQLRRNEISYLDYLNGLEDLQDKYLDDVAKANEEAAAKPDAGEDFFAQRVDQIVQAIATGFSSVASSFAGTLQSAITEALKTGAENSLTDLKAIFLTAGAALFSMDFGGNKNGTQGSVSNKSEPSMFGNMISKLGDLFTTSLVDYGPMLKEVSLSDESQKLLEGMGDSMLSNMNDYSIKRVNNIITNDIASSSNDNKNEELEKESTLLKDIMWAGGGVVAAFSDTIGVVLGLGTAVASFGGMLAGLTREGVGTFFAGKTGIGGASDLPSIYETIDGVVSRFVTEIPTVMTMIAANAGPLIAKLSEGLKVVIPIIMDAAKQFVQILIDNLPAIVEGLTSALGGIIEGVVAMMPQIAELLGGLMSGLLDIIINSIIGNLASIIDGLLMAVVSVIDAILSKLGDIIGSLIEQIPGIIVALVNATSGIITSIVRNIPKIIVSLISHLPKIIFEIIKAIPQIIWAVIKLLPQIAFEFVKALVSSLGDMLGDIPILGDVLGGLSDGIEWLGGAVSDVGDALSSIFGSDKVTKQQTYKDLLAKRSTDSNVSLDLTAMKEILQTQGIEALANRLISMASMGQLTVEQLDAVKQLLSEQELEAAGLAKLGLRVNADQLSRLTEMVKYLEEISSNTTPEQQKIYYDQALAAAPAIRQEWLGTVDSSGNRGMIGAETVSNETLASMISTLQALNVSNDKIQEMVVSFSQSSAAMGLSAADSQKAWELLQTQASQTGLTGDALAAVMKLAISEQQAIAAIEATGQDVTEGPLDYFLKEYQKLLQEYLQPQYGLSAEEARSRAAAESSVASTLYWSDQIENAKTLVEMGRALAEVGNPEGVKKANELLAALNSVIDPMAMSSVELFAIYTNLKTLNAETAAAAAAASSPSASSDSGTSQDPNDWHTGGIVYAHRGFLAKDEVPAVLLTGEGVLNREAMKAIGEDNFRLLNAGVSLEQIMAAATKKYVDVSSGATTGLPPVIYNDSSSQDNSSNQSTEINNHSEDNRTVVQFNNCNFSRNISQEEIEDNIVSNYRNRNGSLQAVIRNKSDNKTSRH